MRGLLRWKEPELGRLIAADRPLSARSRGVNGLGGLAKPVPFAMGDCAKGGGEGGTGMRGRLAVHPEIYIRAVCRVDNQTGGNGNGKTPVS